MSGRKATDVETIAVLQDRCSMQALLLKDADREIVALQAKCAQLTTALRQAEHELEHKTRRQAA